MITAGAQEQQNIARTLTLTIFSPVQLAVGSFYQFHDILEENEILREKIVRIELQNSALRERLSEIADTQDEDFSENFPQLEIISADVIAREPTFFYRTAILNVGANEGIKNSMPVISDGSVVGKIISVLPLTSQVQMLYDPEEYISIECTRTGSVGILDSKTDGTLFTDFRSVAPVVVGDTLFSTGLGGIYPRGLKIGVIERIDTPRAGDIFKRVLIGSAVDFERLRKVFVIKSEPQWKAFRDEIFEFDDERVER
jgi:rod shape-determining protein MreC